MFKRVTDTLSVAGQIAPEDLAAARAQGFVAVINNRPDGEEPGQPDNATMEAAACAQGLAYRFIPVGRDGLSPAMIEATNAVVASAGGPVLAFCRSGTRSITLWALARAHAGADADDLVRLAAAAGYDLSAMRGALLQAARSA